MQREIDVLSRTEEDDGENALTKRDLTFANNSLSLVSGGQESFKRTTPEDEKDLANQSLVSNSTVLSRRSKIIQLNQ